MSHSLSIEYHRCTLTLLRWVPPGCLCTYPNQLTHTVVRLLILGILMCIALGGDEDRVLIDLVFVHQS